MVAEEAEPVERKLGATQEDLILAIGEILPLAGEGFLTRQEIEELTGAKAARVRRILHRLKREGRLVVGTACLPDRFTLRDGHEPTVLAYSIRLKKE